MKITKDIRGLYKVELAFYGTFEVTNHYGDWAIYHQGEYVTDFKTKKQCINYLESK